MLSNCGVAVCLQDTDAGGIMIAAGPGHITHTLGHPFPSRSPSVLKLFLSSLPFLSMSYPFYPSALDLVHHSQRTHNVVLTGAPCFVSPALSPAPHFCESSSPQRAATLCATLDQSTVCRSLTIKSGFPLVFLVLTPFIVGHLLLLAKFLFVVQTFPQR